MALSRTLLLLLFLHLSPLAGRSHPLGGPGAASEVPQTQSQELLDGLQDPVSELEAEQVALEPHQQDRGPAEAREAREADHAGVHPPPQDAAFQTPSEQDKSKKTRSSSCFGRRLSTINVRSDLGCNVMKKN
ncbi:natriuretic peptides B isoform X1 [Choloepus didactylus]|uniref:natriuretic peptides B isoform X1 n=1 Tax=Choloepus didactylus TaxID=27675 RepID=UPI00189F0FBD|nr:natriuretic peptides B isoform X1 [Choloepus didactylus]